MSLGFPLLALVWFLLTSLQNQPFYWVVVGRERGMSESFHWSQGSQGRGEDTCGILSLLLATPAPRPTWVIGTVAAGRMGLVCVWGDKG